MTEVNITKVKGQRTCLAMAMTLRTLSSAMLIRSEKLALSLGGSPVMLMSSDE